MAQLVKMPGRCRRRWLAWACCACLLLGAVPGPRSNSGLALTASARLASSRLAVVRPPSVASRAVSFGDRPSAWRGRSLRVARAGTRQDAPATTLQDAPATLQDAPAAEGGGGEPSEIPDAAWKLVVLALCIVWATNFAVIKQITAQPDVTTSLYTVSRFTIAGLALLPTVFTVSSLGVFCRALECGAWVTFGYLGQAIGLMTTTAAKSCFICALNVVFVAGVVGIAKGKLRPQALLAAALAICGVAFLELAGSQHFVVGDLISLAQPIGFGMGYIRLEEIMGDSPDDAWAVTGTKLLVVMCGSWLFYALSRGALPNLDPVLAAPAALTGVLWCGLVTTALSLVIESVAFRHVDATSASVIFTTEPLWAAAFAFLLIGEPFSANDAVGGALVILANLLNELPSSALPWFIGLE